MNIDSADAPVFDPVRRIFRLPGAAGAAVCSAESSSGEIRGNGDCVLLDFVTGFYALSDGSDRNPAASRNLLERFDHLFAAQDPWRLGAHGPGSPDLAAYLNRLAERSERVLGAMPPTSSCTLTGVKLFRADRRWMGLLLHTGDSALYAVELQGEGPKRLTQNNFWMAGRTERLYQIQWMTVSQESWLILTTDGLPDLPALFPPGKEAGIGERIDSLPVESIPQTLLAATKRHRGRPDDAAAITLVPARLRPGPDRIVMGGTTAREEIDRIDNLERMQGDTLP